jgi:hypothetical protein
VLGAIGIYLAQMLASNGSPQIQPIKVSRPSAIVSDAQINGIIRNVGLRVVLRTSTYFGENGFICLRRRVPNYLNCTVKLPTRADIFAGKSSLAIGRND